MTWDHEFPTEDDIRELEIFTDFKLMKINIRQEENTLDL